MHIASSGEARYTGASWSARIVGFVQRRAVLATLIALAVVFVSLGWRSASPVDATSSADTIDASVLSPRRAPDFLAAVSTDRSTRARISQATAGAGPGCLVVASDGRTIASRNPSGSYIPASTMKLLTASAALDVLGEETTFTTEVKADGKPADGVIRGSLYLVGGGDPLLFTDAFDASFDEPRAIRTSLERLADAVVAAGVRRVEKGIVGDDRRFDDQRSVATWDPAYVQQGTVGPIGALLVDQGFTKFDAPRVSTTSPAAHAATRFTELLQARGITFGATSSIGPTPAKASAIASIESPPVRDIVAVMLTESDNTAAEVLLKHVGVKAEGSGTLAHGAVAARAALEARGVTLEGVNMADGSGLSRNNRVTCVAITKALASHGPQSPLAAALARAGETGTLRDRMTGTPAVGRVRAKTGTLTDVSGLAGWVQQISGPPLLFVQLSNGISWDRSRQVEDRLAIALASLPPPPAATTYAP